MTVLALEDPPVAADGSCAVCGKPRKLDQSELWRHHAERDPFCSAKCCRRWYGCPVPSFNSRGELVEEAA